MCCQLLTNSPAQVIFVLLHEYRQVIVRSESSKTKGLIDLVTAAQERGLFEDLIELLFTSGEIEQLNGRIKIIEGLVLSLETQREMADRLAVSVANITRGSNELKRQPKKVTKFLQDFYHDYRPGTKS